MVYSSFLTWMYGYSSISDSVCKVFSSFLTVYICTLYNIFLISVKMLETKPLKTKQKFFTETPNFLHFFSHYFEWIYEQNMQGKLFLKRNFWSKLSRKRNFQSETQFKQDEAKLLKRKCLRSETKRNFRSETMQNEAKLLFKSFAKLKRN